MVVASNAVVNPVAMVVKLVHAAIAGVAVAGVLCIMHLTVGTQTKWILVFNHCLKLELGFW